MAQVTFANTPEDVQWLRETHLSPKYARGTVPVFASYQLEGNEDCPERLTLFADVEPLVTDRPVAVFTYQDEDGTYKENV